MNVAELNVSSVPGKAQPEGSSAGQRIPAGQPRRWLRIDDHGKSAYIKVQSIVLSSDRGLQRLPQLLTFQRISATA